jgi:hypothetical protein
MPVNGSSALLRHCFSNQVLAAMFGVKGMRTVQQWKKQSRRLRRLDAKAAEVVASMRNGSALHLTFGSSQPSWRLSNGMHVAPDVARLVINLPDVTGVGDVLPIPGALSQTWRYVDEED